VQDQIETFKSIVIDATFTKIEQQF